MEHDINDNLEGENNLMKTESSPHIMHLFYNKREDGSNDRPLVLGYTLG